jgi:mannose-6-phosphate isomerase-like protein (cupin superfamily)
MKKDVSEYIESGILEMYVCGMTNAEETLEVEKMALAYPEIRKEINRLELELEQNASAIAETPDPTIKPFLLATIDYTERLKNGEAPSFPPLLNESSKIEDYKSWLDRSDMNLPDDFDQAYAKLIGYTPEVMTAIIWLRAGSPPEVHTDELEKFLILEGTCDIVIGKVTHQLSAGDYLTIPLHTNHYVRVTSKNPCKAILQRIAA